MGDIRAKSPILVPRSDERLESWKEIAAYLGREVRTVQRWEAEEGLPVHRHPHKKLGTVYAFRSEIDNWMRARSALNHSNVDTLDDIGERQEQPLVGMDLLQGQSLKERLAAGPLALAEVLDVGIQIANALEVAHWKGIVHCNIRPANVLVTRQGQVKLLDFGLVDLVSEPAQAPEDTAAGAEPSTSVEGAMSLLGRATGTVAYTSPEQVRGEEVDARSDLFSFGVLLYEMATGKLPFPGSTKAVIFEAILTKPPAPAELPEELERIIAKALKKDREVRYQTASDLGADLKRLQRALLAPSAPVTAAAAPARHPARLRVWLAAALGAAITALAGWYLLSRRGTAPSWKNATFTQLTSQLGKEYYPSLSPDGKSFIYASRASDNWDIYLQRVRGKNPINLTKDSPADDTEPAFSPDGERIAFRSERDGGGIFVMGASGESAKRLADFGHHPAWSPDGQQIVCATGWFFQPDDVPAIKSQLLVIPAGGSSASWDRRLITPNIEYAVQPHWSPGGRRIAFWSHSGGNRNVWTVPANGGAPVQVTREAGTNWHPVWAPDGRYLYFLSNRSGSMNLWRVPIDEGSGRVLGPTEQVTTPSAYTLHFSLSRDGRRLAYVHQVETGNIYEVDFA
ncbi:MAG: protein kinase [Acidobacteriota bacterium]